MGGPEIASPLMEENCQRAAGKKSFPACLERSCSSTASSSSLLVTSSRAASSLVHIRVVSLSLERVRSCSKRSFASHRFQQLDHFPFCRKAATRRRKFAHLASDSSTAPPPKKLKTSSFFEAEKVEPLPPPLLAFGQI